MKVGDIVRITHPMTLYVKGIRENVPGPVGTLGIMLEPNSDIPWVYYPELGAEAVCQKCNLKVVGHIDIP
jgi:hypothetical protein